MVEKLFAGPFLRNQNWAYLWFNVFEDYRKWLKLNCRPFTFTSYKTFLKNKKRSGTSLSALLSAWFLKKIISVVIFYYLTTFKCLDVFTSWDIGQYVYCSCLLTRLLLQKFWNEPTKMLRQKLKYLENKKSFYDKTKNIFHYF